ncbi:MAG TPA: type I-C CRISPR-associated protein Cas8c/Csd1 [Sphingopyxis sp.]|nr:type I-C CRISPR-associated protein Cas8c/Csd1 [Sphingopyxis sp.]
MTVLQALYGYYDRMAARNEAAAEGYSREKISYAILLRPDGSVADVQDIRIPQEKGKFVSRIMAVPAAKKRASGINPNILWDKSSYVLGVTAEDPKRTGKEHEAFQQVHAEMLQDSQEVGLLALQRFLQQWTPEQFESSPYFKEEMKDANIVFRMDGEKAYIHELPAAIALVKDQADSGDGEDVMCLVTGEMGKAARLHPSVKGVWGAQSAGASLVSFNLDAFTSYGKEQGSNAPVSRSAAARYGIALNALLEKGSRNRIQIGDTTTVFWADASGTGGETSAAAADEWAAHAFDPPSDAQESQKIRELLELVAEGVPVPTLNTEHIDPGTYFYILGLAPNAARLSVRFWYEGTFRDFERRLREHWLDMRIEPLPHIWPPANWHLLIETALQHKSENIPPMLGGELLRAVLNGTAYPRSLMTAIIIRIRAEQGDVTAMRAAILRGILARDYRLGFAQKEVPVALDEQDMNLAYRLGRWFAELEAIQEHALPGLNATIRDRFYGSASSAPARTFPVLIRNAMNHLATLRKDNKSGGHEMRLEAIVAGVEHGLPRALRIEDQARFAIGYYHQRAQRFKKSTDSKDAGIGEETVA